MEISTILANIDNGRMALPEFQRGYVWNRSQIRKLFDSLYHRHPVGGLLVWITESKNVQHRGDGQLAAGTVELLLDGQQRITTLYGVMRGEPPKFFDGNKQIFTGLHFHLNDKVFEFYQPTKMAGDPLWINVSDLMKSGIGSYLTKILELPEQYADKKSTFYDHLSCLAEIKTIKLHIDTITGSEKTLDVVVDIFNQVNSGGTKLSKGDLALAKICVDWPDARREMKAQLKTWYDAGYDFNLDWLLRSVNTVLTGDAKFSFLGDQNAKGIKEALNKATKNIDSTLNMIGGRLGLDHNRVLFGRFAIPVMVRYLAQRDVRLAETERDKLLFWYLQAGMWGRFSSSTESTINQDLGAITEIKGGLDRLIEQLRLWHGNLRVEPEHFLGWSLGARFYPILYMLTRMGGARDWGTGLSLKANLLGKMSKLEVHHIFPKSQLYSRHYKRPEVNALANFCFLTKDTNLDIGNRLPEEYFPEIEEAHPEALKSQWIPADPELWKIKNYREFLEARKGLLADEANRRLEELLHGDNRWLEGSVTAASGAVPIPASDVMGGITSEEEEQELEALNEWVSQQGLPYGIPAFDFADTLTGEQKAVFDLAWPNGLQQELSEPVAVLLNEEAGVMALANREGYRCFTTPADFRHYIETEVLSQMEA